MKRRIVNIFFVMLTVSLTMMGQLSGTKTIDPNGSGSNNYTSFKQAIDTLNTYGVGNGGVTFLLANGTYIEPPLAINIAINKPGLGREVKFVPALNAVVTLTIKVPVKLQPAFVIGDVSSSTDYVILEGSNNNSTDRSFTIDADTSATGIVIYGDHVTVKNVKVAFSDPWTTSIQTIGIVLHQILAADSCLVENCEITANYGILIGTASATPQAGNIIKNNLIHFWHRGIFTANKVNNIVVEANEVNGKTDVYPLETVYGIGLYSSDSTTAYTIRRNIVHNLGSNAGINATARQVNGIYTNGPGQYLIVQNKVFDFFNNDGSTGTELDVHGIYMAGSSTVISTYYVYNNVIYGFQDNDPQSTVNKWSAGIRSGPGQVFIYHNSVFIPGTARNHFTAPILLESGMASDTVRIANNIFYCTQLSQGGGNSKVWGIYRGNTQKSFMVSDYNVMCVEGTTNTFVGKDGTNGDKKTLALWQAAGFDKHSAVKAVTFVSSSSDLHLTGSSLGDIALAGIPIPGITTDIEGNARNTTHPYLGAYEATAPLIGVNVSSSAIDFGQCAVGDSLVDTVYIRATYNKEFIVTSLSHSSSEFLWALTVPDTVRDSTAVMVTFKPHAIGSSVDTLKIISDFGTASVLLAGTSPKPVLVSSVKLLNFGTVKVDSAAVLTISIVDSSINRLVIDSIYTKTSEFLVDRSDASVLSDTLTLLVAFMPTKPGSFVDTVYLRNNGIVSLVKIPLAGIAGKADAVVLAEDFTSPVGTVLTDAGWTVSGSNNASPIGISTAGGLSFGRYSASGIGNASSLTTSGQDVFKSFPAINSGSVYLSFMVNVASAQAGDYFIAVSSSASQTNYFARFHIKSTTGGYVLGISKSSEVSGGAVYGTTVLSYGATNLVVVKYTFLSAAPADTLNDPISVYAFTTSIPASEPTTPEVGPYTYTSKSDAIDLGSVTLRQGSSTAAPALVLDGIRVATTWTLAVPTGVKELATEVPHEFSLKQNYPNPFNPSTKIEFTVPQDGYTTLRVYNLLGQPVSTLFGSVAHAGKLYQCSFEGSSLPTGIYFARLESGTQSSMRKMLLVK